MHKYRPAPTPRLLGTLASITSDAPLPHVSALGLITLFTLPLLLVFLGTGDAVDMMELFNLVPIREAIRDHHWLMPTLDGIPRLAKPPLPVWIPAAFALFARSDSLWILRLPSVVMGLLTGFATYGLGCTFFKNAGEPPAHERKYALLAAILLPAMILFNREAHLASYDIYATGFLTGGAFFLALAAERGSVGALGYAVLAGIATGLSILSKGPVPVATVMVPLGIWLLMFHRATWKSAWLSVAVAAIVSVCVFVPWLAVIGGIPGVIAAQQPSAWHVWYAELFQFGTGNSVNGSQSKASLSDPWYYYFQVFLWVAPLTPTLIAALVMPFLKSSSEPAPSALERRGRWLFWLTLVGGLLMLTVPSEKKPRYALQLLPFAALLCAAVWQEFRRLPAERKLEWPAVISLAGQALFFVVPAVGGLVGIVWAAVSPELPPWLGGMETVDVLRSLPRPLALLLFFGAAAAGIYFWRAVYRRQFGQAMVALALSSWTLVLAGQSMYRADPSNHTNPARTPVEQAMSIVGPYPVYSLPGHRPWLPTLYYADRPLPQMDVATLTALAKQSPEKPFSLVFILGNRVRNDPGVEAELHAFEAATRREPDFITTWYDADPHPILSAKSKDLHRFDNDRHTAFYHFAPQQAQSQSATRR